VPIPMENPAKYLAALASGEAYRDGCLIKDSATKRILSHLKEGDLTRLGPSVLRPFDLLTGAGAAASVVGLGVSVAGFALVLSRLNRLENNLNDALGRLRAEVERVQLTLDLLQMAELHAAWERLEGAGRTSLPGRPRSLLESADETFQRYRNYYHQLINRLRPQDQPRLGLPQVRELYGRFFACCQAELEANFLLGDFAQWRHRHGAIARQAAEACGFDAPAALRSRLAALKNFHENDLQATRLEVRLTRDFCRENQARLATADAEVRWVEARKISPEDYLEELRGAVGMGLVLVPHDG
jgi:hypothetical protein